MCSLGRDILNGNCALQMRDIWALWRWKGVLYLKPYLTAWINSPLFQCWAGTPPLLVLFSVSNHTGSLSPFQCTVSCTGITNQGPRRGSEHTAPLYDRARSHDWGACLLDMSVKYMSAPIARTPFSNVLLPHLFIFQNALQICIATVSVLPCLSYIKKYFFKQRSVECNALGSFHILSQTFRKGDLVEAILHIFWIVRHYFWIQKLHTWLFSNLIISSQQKDWFFESVFNICLFFSYLLLSTLVEHLWFEMCGLYWIKSIYNRPITVVYHIYFDSKNSRWYAQYNNTSVSWLWVGLHQYLF